jgi:hypothetical protein
VNSRPKRVETAPFDGLIAELRARGLSDAAGSLSRLKGAAWTTSSEMIGELGLAVLRLQKQRGLSPELMELCRRCMSEVRKVWPSIRLP